MDVSDTQFRTRRLRTISIAVLVVGLAAAGLRAAWVAADNAATVRARFETFASRCVDEIAARMRIHGAIFEGLEPDRILDGLAGDETSMLRLYDVAQDG